MLTYLVQLHSQTFGVTPVKGARSHVTPCPGRGDRRAMFVHISPPARTHAMGAQVVQGCRHGQGGGLGTWVCEQRIRESKLSTNGVREIVVARLRRAGQRLMDDMKINNIQSHEYALYAYDTGIDVHGRGLC